ncbi:TPA: DUF2441 domain-containing protein [Enterobacter hormaechei]
MSDDYFYITSSKIEAWNPYPTIAAGDIIETGDVNPFFNFFLSANLRTEPVNNGGVIENWSWMRFLGAIRDGSMKTPMSTQDVAAKGHYLAMYFCKYTRELIWEAVRLADYGEKPSRHRCLWLSLGEQNLNYWKSQVVADQNLRQIFRVEIDGRTHEASDEHLMNDNVPYHEALDMSHRYWKGEISNPLAKEILFEGKMRVIERVE